MKKIKSPQNVQKVSSEVSLFLATIIAGAAIITAIDGYFAKKPLLEDSLVISWPLVCQLVAIILTTLRFFHGNAMWYMWEFAEGAAKTTPLSSIQKVVNKLAHYYVHIFQYILFFVAGKAVGNIMVLLKVFIGISIVDVVWTSYNWLFEQDKDLRCAIGSWFILNSISAIILIVILICKLPIDYENYRSYALVGVYGSAALIDYLYNSKLYFGIGKETNHA